VAFNPTNYLALIHHFPVVEDNPPIPGEPVRSWKRPAGQGWQVGELTWVENIPVGQTRQTASLVAVAAWSTNWPALHEVTGRQRA
jgi:hypothetical protein